ncbi:hypothetical protein TraAM80_06833 [Trypanosoma rangeli]|uniref:Uncharacterized protein n=1 Tax=Trypanosoma rangeli TaxID=5698 RepID=A0A3R7NEV5_TRYRA|nr:uncharacterized protein TraAM80_06833 [Trypanosoma rangeli]RNF01665.1 hypothetical protein TraAM80_06833 [Trypanosoma rangeli]|eukprot:RNF01665.1 hypothetical protein TraAM80_06833 [Trypanosoma rangeli]
MRVWTQTPVAARHPTGFAVHNLSSDAEKMSASPPDAGGNREREAEIEQLHQLVGAAAGLVFKQRLAIHRMNCGSLPSGKEHRPLHTSVSRGDACNVALQRLADLEDHLSQETSRCIRFSNVTALHFLNAKHYSRALQILLREEAMTQRGAGKWFPFFSTTESIEMDVRNFVQSMEDHHGGDKGCMQEIFVPFFTKRHEKMRQLAFAVVNNNIGLYHFKLAEYELAVRRMSHALHLEEALGVETIGVTYFNLAQAQYECGNVEEALTAISLAEEAIERRIYESETQMNSLHRIAKHGCDDGGGSASIVPGLERRRLDVHISWRESVCLLSRVLEAHGRWLQSSTAYKAAIHRFEQSDRWLSSVKRLSAEENKWRQELRQRIQECKRAQRHSCCHPKSTALYSSPLPSRSSAHPRSIIVTTTLPRRIEITTCATPFDNFAKLNEKEDEENRVAGVDLRHPLRQRRQQLKQHQHQGQKKQNERRVKPGHKDVYDFSNISPTAAAAELPHCRNMPRRPAWDSDTHVVHRDSIRRRTATPTASSLTHTNSETRTSSRLTSTAHTPFSRGAKSGRETSGRPTLSSEMELTPSDVQRRQRSSQAEACTPLHRPQSGHHAVARRAWDLNNSDELSPPTTSTSERKVCAPSLGRCIHVLQAFARARLSLFEREWRRLPCGTGLVSSQNHSYFLNYSLSSFSSCSDAMLNTDGALCLAKAGDCVLKNGGASVRTAPVHSTRPPRAAAILLAFLSARRSASLACQRRIEQQYARVMERVLQQYTACAASSLPTTARMQMLRGSERNRTWAEVQPQVTNGSYAAFPPHRGESSPNRNDKTRLGSGGSMASSEDNTNCAHLAEGRFCRRYSSLLRMLPHGGEPPNTSLDAITVANNHLNGDATSVNTRSTGPHVYSSSSATPPVSEDLAIRNGGVEDFSTSSWCSRRRSDFSSTPLSETNPQKANRHPHILSLPRDENAGIVRCGHTDLPTADVFSNDVQNQLPPRHPVARRLPFLSWESANGAAYTTAGILRQRLLRTEAATIIQVAWRNWRERRRMDAVRKLKDLHSYSKLQLGLRSRDPSEKTNNRSLLRRL